MTVNELLAALKEIAVEDAGDADVFASQPDGAQDDMLITAVCVRTDPHGVPYVVLR